MQITEFENLLSGIDVRGADIDTVVAALQVLSRPNRVMARTGEGECHVRRLFEMMY